MREEQAEPEEKTTVLHSDAVEDTAADAIEGEVTVKHKVAPHPVAEIIEAPPPAPKRKAPLPEWLGLFGLAGIFVGVIMIAVVIGWVINRTRTNQAANPFADDLVDVPTATPNATPDPEFLATPIPAWQGDDRVTILLLGADARPGENTSRPLTDSIMLLMLDPSENVAGVLSIPRDLYMEVPGYGLNRVNTAYPLGGGPLAVDTIQYNFGVHIDYFVVVSFEAFITLVDEIGGIQMDIPEPISDTEYPAYCETRTNCGYDPFYIDAGLQTLDGETALKYARTRKADNDYERARRQQAVLLAIRDKVTQPENFPTLISRAPALFEALSDNISTNMTLEQMVALAGSANEVNEGDIRTGVIDGGYVSRYFTPQGADVLIPNRQNLGDLLYEIFWQECLNGGCPHASE